MNQYSDAYQYERAEWLGASKSSIQKALKRLNITYILTSYYYNCFIVVLL
ncbi:putative transposase [Orientia tsutsugamushi str. Karp]|nr:putative transposase [Orientia tsutsugamushi str. Karp]